MSVFRSIAIPVAVALSLLTSTAGAQHPVVLVSVSAAQGIACAVVARDTVEQFGSSVYCWGDDRSGVWTPSSRAAIWGPAGHPSATPRLIPMPDSVTAGGIVSLAVGATAFACLVNSSGAVYCWGENDFGEIGDGSTTARRSPSRVALPEPATAVSAGEYSACAVTRGGRIFCWGDNEHGKLGAGDTTAHPRPVAVNTAAEFASVAVGASGGTCGLTTTAAARCWGVMDGELGLKMSEEPQQNPITPIGVSAERYRSISVGNSFACALREDGQVRCWGNDAAAELGGGAPSRGLGQRIVSLPGGEKATQVGSGFKSACALTASGRVACWGSNHVGELGRGIESAQERAPGFVAGDSRYLAMSVGGSMVCAITVTHALACWGSTHRGIEAEERAMRRVSRPKPVVIP